jgi:hypothetical protein
MIIDHRTYTLHPGKIGDFLKIYEEKGLPIQREILGDLIGWYVSMDIGQLNQVVHLWRYQDLNDRAERRGRLNANPDWQAYLKAATPFLQHMENKILTAAPFFQQD